MIINFKLKGQSFMKNLLLSVLLVLMCASIVVAGGDNGQILNLGDIIK